VGVAEVMCCGVWGAALILHAGRKMSVFLAFPTAITGTTAMVREAWHGGEGFSASLRSMCRGQGGPSGRTWRVQGNIPIVAKSYPRFLIIRIRRNYCFFRLHLSRYSAQLPRSGDVLPGSGRRPTRVGRHGACPKAAAPLLLSLPPRWNRESTGGVQVFPPFLCD